MLGTVHFVFALAALISGGLVVCRRKGGPRHRAIGYFYSISLLLVNLGALLVYEESVGAGPFHILALISLSTLVSGFIPAFFRRPADSWLGLHAYFMSWSYVGLVAAGAAQFVTMAADLSPWLAVGTPSILAVLLGGTLIHTRVPDTLAVLARRRGPDDTIR